MSIYVATQKHFDSIKEIGESKNAAMQAIVRCRCQPNTCSRPVCKGCVQCLRRTPDASKNNELLASFFAI